MQPKFNIGQTVECDGEQGEVVSFTYDSDRGFMYKITSKEVDLGAKKISEGFKTVHESELKPVKEEGEANAN